MQFFKYNDSRLPKWREARRRDNFAVEVVLTAARSLQPFEAIPEDDVPGGTADVAHTIEHLEEFLAARLAGERAPVTPPYADLTTIARAVQGERRAPGEYLFQAKGMMSLYDLPPRIADQAKTIHAMGAVIDGNRARGGGRYATAKMFISYALGYAGSVIGEEAFFILEAKWRLYDCLGYAQDIPEQVLTAFQTAWMIGQHDFACKMARGYLRSTTAR